MKTRYLLEMYDSLLEEIHNPKLFVSETITSILNKTVTSFHFIYKIDFIQNKNQITFQVSDAIHSLHPEAPLVNKRQSALQEPYLKLLPEIEKQLNIRDKNKSYFWGKDKQLLFILVENKLEELSAESLFFYYCNWFLTAESKQIKIKIKATVSSLHSKDKIQTYIQKKQANITSLLNKLLLEINPDSIDNLYNFSPCYQDVDCLKLIFVQLEKILIYLEQEYYRFMDYNMAIPLVSLGVLKKAVQQPYQEIMVFGNQAHFYKKSTKAIAAVLSKIMITQPCQILSYQERDYIMSFATKLLELIKNSAEPNQLSEYLFRLNFNSLDFFDDYTDQISRNLEELSSDTDKIKELHKQLKANNQKYLYLQTKLIPQLPSVKEQINAWIEEEIHYLNQKKIVDNITKNLIQNSEPEEKILTSFSVPQLGYFFGLLFQNNIMQAKSQKAYFRFVSKNFRTKITDNISVDSLNSKYYNPESGTIDMVRQKLIDLLNSTKF
ncbi:hypothetical protein RCH33_938 [Flavobacterium daejeonense]|nr:hypothetical protein RCH33_938 [Flavobacterium daejeonense]